MGIDKLSGVAESLAFSGTSGSASSPCNEIQDWETDDSVETVDFKVGDANVFGKYKGPESAYIKISTSDASFYTSVKEGDTFESLVLTVNGALEINGTAVGGQATYTISDAVLQSKEPVGGDNASRVPVVGTLEFQMYRPAADGSDPTAVWAAVV